ncbi:hypothetical protein CMUS01_16059 [Colletotrichum musicola]|uniref:Uncharacterized protein n=1 Tax=Colletotrichum musicola TaxID=2175873 RepID=A0A8H6IS84_9PEZI|nr:hypothetical protein CMUS01_16059 [Colletotrichum musicola]
MCAFFNHDAERDNVQEDQDVLLGAKEGLSFYQAILVCRYPLLVTNPDERESRRGALLAGHESASLTYRIGRAALAARTLVVSPADVAVDTMEMARSFFTDTIFVRMGDARYRYLGMRVVVWHRDDK